MSLRHMPPDSVDIAAEAEAMQETGSAARITDEVRECIASLETDGRLRPDTVVDEARDEDSPLHPFFEWDDSAAAESYRIEQARTLIRRVRVEVTVTESVIVVPRYVRDPEAGEQQGYVTQEQLRSEPANARKLVVYEIARAQAYVERARRIAASLGFEREFARLLRSLAGVRQKVEERGA